MKGHRRHGHLSAAQKQLWSALGAWTEEEETHSLSTGWRVCFLPGNVTPQRQAERWDVGGEVGAGCGLSCQAVNLKLRIWPGGDGSQKARIPEGTRRVMKKRDGDPELFTNDSGQGQLY